MVRIKLNLICSKSFIEQIDSDERLIFDYR